MSSNNAAQWGMLHQGVTYVTSRDFSPLNMHLFNLIALKVAPAAYLAPTADISANDKYRHFMTEWWIWLEVQDILIIIAFPAICKTDLKSIVVKLSERLLARFLHLMPCYAPVFDRSILSAVSKQISLLYRMTNSVHVCTLSNPP